MTVKVDPDCSCDCSCPGRNVSARRAMCAGAFGGIIGVVVVAVLAAFLLRRVGPRLMARMMRDCECSSEMKACMDKCCRGPGGEERPAS